MLKFTLFFHIITQAFIDETGFFLILNSLLLWSLWVYSQENSPDKINEIARLFLYGTQQEITLGIKDISNINNIKFIDTEGKSLSVLETVATWSEKNNIFEIVKLLCEKKSCITDLVICRFAGSHYKESDIEQILDFLLKKGGNCNARSLERDNSTALHCAARANNPNAAKILLKAGALINAVDDYGMTALHWACYRGSFKTVNTLLENNANFSLTDNNGDTIFHAVMRENELLITNNKKKIKILHALLSYVHKYNERKTFLVNHQNKKGETPLHIAVKENNYRAIPILFQCCLINAELKDIKGRTAYDVACKNDYQSAGKLLLRYRFIKNLITGKKVKMKFPFTLPQEVAAMIAHYDSINSLAQILSEKTEKSLNHVPSLANCV